jgi:hypothetical protein
MEIFKKIPVPGPGFVPISEQNLVLNRVLGKNQTQFRFGFYYDQNRTEIDE